MILAATGHRPDKLGGYTAAVDARLLRVAREYLALSPCSEVVSGMALGWDTAVALAAVELGIPFVAAVPFAGHECKWPKESRARHAVLIKRASRVHVVSPGGYEPWKMQRRNEYMVKMADRIVALWNGTPGGTANCVGYAEKRGVPIDNVWEEFAA